MINLKNNTSQPGMQVTKVMDLMATIFREPISCYRINLNYLRKQTQNKRSIIGNEVE